MDIDIQLSSSVGQISAFDCHDDVIALLTSKSVDIFSPYSFGGPQTVLYHEHTKVSKQVKLQKSWNSKLLSTLGGGIVSIYDPRQCVNQLVHIVKRGTSIIDHNWSPVCPNVLSTCTSSSVVSLWDIRSPLRVTHEISVGKPCDMVKFSPLHSYLISVRCDSRYVVLWDVRMMRDDVTNISDCSYAHIIMPSEGVVHYSWSQTNDGLYLLSNSGDIEQWAVNCQNNGLTCEQSGGIVCRYENTCPTSKLIVNNTNDLFLINTVTEPTCCDIAQRASCHIKCFSPVDTLRDLESHDAIRLSSCGNGWNELGTIDFSHNDILDVQWVDKTAWNGLTSNALLIMHNTGILSVHNLQQQIKGDVSQLSKRGKASRILRNARHIQTTTASELRLSVDNLGNSRRSFGSRLHSLSTLKNVSRNVTTLGNITTKQVIGPRLFLCLVEEQLTALDNAIRSNTGLLDGLRIERLDYFSRRVVLELLLPTSESFATRNKSTNKVGNSSGFPDFSLSQYYRGDDFQQTGPRKGSISLNVSPWPSHCSTTNRSVALIITFPYNYSSFWMPSFVIDNKAGFELGGDTMLSTVIHELAMICRVTSTHSSSSPFTTSWRPSTATIAGSNCTPGDCSTGECLLLQIARTFRRRILRLWERRMESDRLSVSFGSFHPNNSGDNLYSNGIVNLAGTGVDVSVAVDASSNGQQFVDASSSYFNNISVAAFQVPYPRSFGASFNSNGNLVHFGGVSDVKSGVAEDSPRKAIACDHMRILKGVGKDACHSSYATYLINMMLKRTETASALSSTLAPTIIAASKSDEHIENDHGQHERPCVSSIGDDTSISEIRSIANATHCLPTGSLDDEDDYQFSFDKDVRATVNTSKDCGDFCDVDEEYCKSIDTATDVQCLTSCPVMPSCTAVRDDYDPKTGWDLNSHHQTSRASKQIQSNLLKAVSSNSIDNFTIAVYRNMFNFERCLSVEYSLGQFFHPRSCCSKMGIVNFHDKATVCRYNATIVESLSIGSRELIQFWNLLAISLDVSTLTDTGGLISWNFSALGVSLFARLFAYLRKQNDLQTYAVAICVLGGAKAVVDLLQNCSGLMDSSSDPSQNSIGYHNNLLHSYASILYQWQEPQLATEVLKHMHVNTVRPPSLDLCVTVRCCNCNKLLVESNDAVKRGELPSSFMWCSDCTDWAQYCSVCQTCVRGIFSLCSLCGHGGHADHLRDWFKCYDECATGCGCRCANKHTDRVIVGENMKNEADYDSDLNDGNSSTSGGSESSDDLYERQHVIHSFHGNNENSLNNDNDVQSPIASVYDTYDLMNNRPHYIENVLSENNYREYNYNNFYEIMQDFLPPAVDNSILEEEENELSIYD